MKLSKEPGESAVNSREYGYAVNSREYGYAVNLGEYGYAANSGHRGSAENLGYRGYAANSGLFGSAANSGHYGFAASSGYRGAAESSTPGTAAIVTGLYGKARAEEFGCIALAWWNAEGNRVEMRCALVGKEKGQLKPNVWYSLDRTTAEFVEDRGN